MPTVTPDSSAMSKILGSLKKFGALDAAEARRSILEEEDFREWLREIFPPSEKYRLSKAADGTYVKSYPPEFSGRINCNQDGSGGTFGLRQKSLFTRDLRDYNSKEEQRYGWISLGSPQRLELFLTYFVGSVEFNIDFQIPITVGIPGAESGESPEWSAIRSKGPWQRYFPRSEEVSVPYDLIESWTSGELGSTLHIVVSKSDDRIGYGGLHYRYGFYRWFRALGADPLGLLQRAGCMDQDTLKLMRAKLQEPMSIVSSVMIRDEDKAHLRILAKVESEAKPLTYSQLARLLGYRSKGGGCHGFISRMQDNGLIEVEEGPGGSGILIRLTPAGRSVL